MKRDDLLLFLLALVLLLAMVLTYFFRDQRSRHGYGVGINHHLLGPAGQDPLFLFS